MVPMRMQWTRRAPRTDGQGATRGGSSSSGQMHTHTQAHARRHCTHTHAQPPPHPHGTHSPREADIYSTTTLRSDQIHTPHHRALPRGRTICAKITQTRTRFGHPSDAAEVTANTIISTKTLPWSMLPLPDTAQ